MMTSSDYFRFHLSDCSVTRTTRASLVRFHVYPRVQTGDAVLFLLLFEHEKWPLTCDFACVRTFVQVEYSPPSEAQLNCTPQQYRAPSVQDTFPPLARCFGTILALHGLTLLVQETRELQAQQGSRPFPEHTERSGSRPPIPVYKAAEGPDSGGGTVRSKELCAALAYWLPEEPLVRKGASFLVNLRLHTRRSPLSSAARIDGVLAMPGLEGSPCPACAFSALRSPS
ncbi:hypothetical protein NDU88_005805 [Pleurodeles waltl]|uniref:Uncharacterized protein n=1 Tax=Pleurodeles waltl TaxID=8319 RepID=A0AAV7UM44_PLEWA|nr:hypothetical protein NDU88_005805 [Pleurodeles waltl]